MRLITCVLALLFLVGPASAVPTLCDCRPALRHLCRCGVTIDQEIADLQLAYLNRLFEMEFKEFLDGPLAVTSIRLVPAHSMVLEGEAVQGYYENNAIVLNSELLRDQALMVIAHELGHAWHFASLEQPDEVSDFLAEGFAEWVSYHLMRRAGMTEYCSRLLENPDPLYGNGLRWFRKIEHDFGTEAVIDIMRNWLDHRHRPL